MGQDRAVTDLVETPAPACASLYALFWDGGTKNDAHGQAYRSLSAQAELFHRQLVQILNAGAGRYAVAEADATRLIAQA
jgi:hypothetical protein